MCPHERGPNLFLKKVFCTLLFLYSIYRINFFDAILNFVLKEREKERERERERERDLPFSKIVGFA